jgi:hypothetical protein
MHVANPNSIVADVSSGHPEFKIACAFVNGACDLSDVGDFFTFIASGDTSAFLLEWRNTSWGALSATPWRTQRATLNEPPGYSSC